MEDNWQGEEAKAFLLKILSEALRVVGMDTYDRSLMREFISFVKQVDPQELTVMLYKNMLTAFFDTEDDLHDSYSFAIAFDNKRLALSYDDELVTAELSGAYGSFVKLLLKKCGKKLAGN